MRDLGSLLSVVVVLYAAGGREHGMISLCVAVQQRADGNIS